DGELDQHRCEGSEKDHGNGCDAAASAAIVAFAAHAAKNHAPAGNRCEKSDGAGQCGRNRADQDVAIAHVAQLVGEHAFEFFIVEQTEDALGYGGGGVVRVASGGEGVRRVGRDEVDLGHGQADFLRQALDDVVDPREIFAADGLGAIGGEGDLV